MGIYEHSRLLKYILLSMNPSEAASKLSQLPLKTVHILENLSLKGTSLPPTLQSLFMDGQPFPTNASALIR